MAQRYNYPINEHEFGHYDTPEIIALDDCKPDRAYWGEGASIGCIAICEESAEHGLIFTGLANHTGADLLQPELHKDAVNPEWPRVEIGTFLPLTELPEKLPNTADKMEWLRDTEYEILLERLAWLLSAPDGYVSPELRVPDLAQTRKRLAELERMRQHGFSEKAVLFGKSN